jgi:hypothetical protein
MRTIHKFPISVAGENYVPMPEGSLFRHFGEQDGNLYMWVEVNTNHEQAVRIYIVVGTGDSIPRYAEYRGTSFSGPFVWHLYEL